jgi:hypothetical protein
MENIMVVFVVFLAILNVALLILAISLIGSRQLTKHDFI